MRLDSLLDQGFSGSSVRPSILFNIAAGMLSGELSKIVVSLAEIPCPMLWGSTPRFRQELPRKGHMQPLVLFTISKSSFLVVVLVVVVVSVVVSVEMAKDAVTHEPSAN